MVVVQALNSVGFFGDIDEQSNQRHELIETVSQMVTCLPDVLIFTHYFLHIHIDL